MKRKIIGHDAPRCDAIIYWSAADRVGAHLRVRPRGHFLLSRIEG